MTDTRARIVGASSGSTSPSIEGAQTSGTVTGELYILKETYNGPEDETATGPNFPRENKISVAIAPGQTITNLDVTDALPNNLQYMSVVETSIRGTSTTTTALSTPSTSTPGGTVTQQFTSVTGTGAANDVTQNVFSNVVVTLGTTGTNNNLISLGDAECGLVICEWCGDDTSSRIACDTRCWRVSKAFVPLGTKGLFLSFCLAPSKT